MTASKRVVVFGATGFIGTAVVQALLAREAVVVPIRTPHVSPSRADQVHTALQGLDQDISRLARRLQQADCVVNAAGVAEATSTDEDYLTAGNVIVPGYLGTAAAMAGVPRFVHVSSAAVQGRTCVLDSSPLLAPFSAYSRSKASGELLAGTAHPGAVLYRPPGVHGPGRRTTQLTARLARSPVSSVARPGGSPSPQSLLTNVADAIAFLATTDTRPPPVVAHPSEGLTTASVLTFLGGRPPREVPRLLARSAVAVLTAGGRALPRIAAQARRVEMLWFGQPQAPSWLTEAGWSPPAGHDHWRELGVLLAATAHEPR